MQLSQWYGTVYNPTTEDLNSRIVVVHDCPLDIFGRATVYLYKIIRSNERTGRKAETASLHAKVLNQSIVGGDSDRQQRQLYYTTCLLPRGAPLS